MRRTRRRETSLHLSAALSPFALLACLGILSIGPMMVGAGLAIPWRGRHWPNAVVGSQSDPCYDPVITAGTCVMLQSHPDSPAPIGRSDPPDVPRLGRDALANGTHKTREPANCGFRTLELRRARTNPRIRAAHATMHERFSSWHVRTRAKRCRRCCADLMRSTRSSPRPLPREHVRTRTGWGESGKLRDRTARWHARTRRSS